MEGGNLRTPQDLRLPLQVPIGSRDGTFNKDSYLQNLFVEKQGDRWYAIMRPGSTAYTTFDGGGAGVSQGLWQTRGFLLAANNNNLTRIVSPTSAGFTLGSAWATLTQPTWSGRANMAAVVFNNQIFVIGGTISIGAVAVADVWASSDGGTTWIQVVAAAPWGVRSNMKALVFNNRLYLMGGADGLGNFYNDVWVTDDGVTWSQVTNGAGWSPRSNFAAVVYNNGMWVLGGSGFLNDVWFSTDGQTWVQMVAAASWVGRSGHAAEVFLGKLWIYGGAIFGGAPGGRESWWTVDGITWTMATNAAFSTARSLFGHCVYNGAMWAICGLDGGGLGPLTQVWSSIDGANWVQATAAFGSTVRYACSTVVFKHPTSTVAAPTMYLMGGVDLVPTYLKDLWLANINGTLGTTWAFPSPATTPYQQMQAVPINNNQYFAIKDTRGMYVWYADKVEAVSDRNYPPVTVPGVVNLDETVYVMDPSGLICGSAIGTPLIWPSRNFLGADYESDPGVALLKYQNFVMAIGQYTTQFFINSGSPSQTTLRPVKNMNARIGGAFPYAALAIEDTVVWLGRMEKSKELQVFRMVGNSAQVISTASEDRIINAWPTTDDVRAVHVKRKGHSFYVLENLTSNLSIAFDLNTGHWARWTITDDYYSYSHTATDGVNDYALAAAIKAIKTIEPTTYNDSGTAIKVRAVTPLVDNGTGLRKNCSGLSLICDRVPSGTVTFEYTKDDYQTWSTPVTINRDQPRVHMNRIGKYVRIAYRITINENLAFRGEALETEVRIGN